MATITRGSSVSMDASNGMFAPQITGNLYAGEVLDAGAPCYIKASDGNVYMSNGTAANEAAKLDGFVARTCQIGEPVTLFGVGSRFRYGTGLTVGADLYISATKGRLDDAPTAGGLSPVARVLAGGQDIRVLRNSEGASDAGISASPTSGIGYGTGAGGAVTQITNRTTGVTLSKVTGQITTHNASLGAELSADFIVTNTTVAIGDVVVVSIQSGANSGNTAVSVTTVTNGSFTIKVSNNNAAAGTAETGAIIINYAVIKAVAA